MDNSENLILVFYPLSEFLNIDEVLALFSCSKQLRTLFPIVHQTGLPKFQKYSSNKLATIGRLFPNITDLSLFHQGHWNINLQNYTRLIVLSICGGLEFSSDQYGDNPVDTRLRCLRLSGIVGRNCQGIYDFMRRFVNLRLLSLKRTSPILLSTLLGSLVSLPHLESLELSECFTDRNELLLDGLYHLRNIEISKCMNLIGISSSQRLERLSQIRITNCPISITSLIGLISNSPVLKNLVISQCNSLIGTLNISGRSCLKSIHISHCSKLTCIHISCASLSSLEMRMCYALRSFNCKSSVLAELNLSQHASLTELHLECPELTELNIIGCRSLGSHPTEKVMKSNQISRLPGLVSALSLQAKVKDDIEDSGGEYDIEDSGGENDIEDSGGEDEIEDDAENSKGAADLGELPESESGKSDSDISSTSSARRVSSKTVLYATTKVSSPTALEIAQITEISYSKPAEELLVRNLCADCPRLDVRTFLRFFIHDTQLAVHREKLLALLPTISSVLPHRSRIPSLDSTYSAHSRSDGGAGVVYGNVHDIVGDSPGGSDKKGNSRRKTYHSPPVKRKSRRAKKSH